MYIIITYFVNPSERRETPPIITDSSHARLAKMAGEEEGVLKKEGRRLYYKTLGATITRDCGLPFERDNINLRIKADYGSQER